MTDERVRKAIIHAIDREGIAKNLVGAGSRVLHTNCFPSQFGCTDEGEQRAAKLGPEVVAYATTSNLWTVYGKTRPRGLVRFPWRTRRMQLWRLEQLVHPLWLGQDGVIYRAYEADGYSSMWSEPYHHWLRAELEFRNVTGLERVLNALKALEPSAAGTSNI